METDCTFAPGGSETRHTLDQRPVPDPAEPRFCVRLAASKDEVEAAQRLRYRVFVEELGSDGPMVDHRRKLEMDRFDNAFDHLILTASTRPGEVIGVYRLLRDERAREIGQFYSEDEYDLAVLKRSGRRLLELGRSCVDPAFRGGMAMYHLWNGLAHYVEAHKIDILFGVASFHGTDVARLSAPLSLLWHRHRAPPDLRVTAKPPAQPMGLVPEAELDRRAAMVQVPALIKAYLKLGGYVGDGAFIDHEFQTTDVCLVVDTKRIVEAQKALYGKELAR